MQFIKSSLGRKYIMAVTGLFLVLFLVAHLSANLLLFAGPDAFNAYGHGLRQYPALLLVARSGLIGLFLLHIAVALSLRWQNRAARPVAYASETSVAATLASRTMVHTGLLILAFVLYHLAHYTLFLTNPEFAGLRDAQGRHDTFTMVVTAFQNPILSASYIVAMMVLGFHLRHGLPSLFQSLGLSTSTVWPRISALGQTIALLLMVGFLSIPLAVWLQLIQLPRGS